MRLIPLLCCLCLAFAPAPLPRRAILADPTGHWLCEDGWRLILNDNGSAFMENIDIRAHRMRWEKSRGDVTVTITYHRVHDMADTVAVIRHGRDYKGEFFRTWFYSDSKTYRRAVK